MIYYSNIYCRWIYYTSRTLTVCIVNNIDKGTKYNVQCTYCEIAQVVIGEYMKDILYYASIATVYCCRGLKVASYYK